MTDRTIPTVHMAGRSAAELAAPIAEAFSDLGFVALSGHGVDAGLIGRVYGAARAFFALPDGTKRRYHIPTACGARGYTPFGVEKAKDQSVADLKEFWHVGRELDAAALEAAGLPANVWPQEVPDFRAATLELYGALDALGMRVLSAVARSLRLDPNYFDGVIDRGNSILRPLHYPPIASSAAQSVAAVRSAAQSVAAVRSAAQSVAAVRSAAHEDINLITLLVASAEPGLQILTREGAYIDAPTGEDLIICNVGDMLQRLTNHVLPSTTHRVINPPGAHANVSRYSIPFFLHPNSDFLIESLPCCIDEHRPNRYPEPILADDYLQQRLREIGLM